MVYEALFKPYDVTVAVKTLKVRVIILYSYKQLYLIRCYRYSVTTGTFFSLPLNSRGT